MINSKDTLSKIRVMGGIRETIVGEFEINEKAPFSFNEVDFPPIFKKDKNLPKEKLLVSFDKNLKQFITDNFDKSVYENLGLTKGKKRIFTRIIINKKGEVSQIEVRAPHIDLKKHIKEVLQKLPQFIPAKKKGKNVSVTYFLPIKFKIN